MRSSRFVFFYISFFFFQGYRNNISLRVNEVSSIIIINSQLGSLQVASLEHESTPRSIVQFIITTSSRFSCCVTLFAHCQFSFFSFIVTGFPRNTNKKNKFFWELERNKNKKTSARYSSKLDNWFYKPVLIIFSRGGNARVRINVASRLFETIKSVRFAW